MIQFICKKKCRGDNCDSDVRVTIRNHPKRGRTLEVTFYNFSYKRITQGDYIECGIEGDRLFFAESNSARGYKIYPPTVGGDRVRTLKATLSKENIYPCTGALEYDEQYKLYFVRMK